MTAALLVAAGAALYGLGYVARCVRPLQRIDTWAWEQDYLRCRDLRTGPARRRPGWYVAQTVFAVEVAGLLVVRPRRMVHEFRHRNDPPAPREPAPRFDPEWAAKRQAAEGG